MVNWLITTDLDGTLLNHHTYDVTGVAALIERLQQYNIPVILNSSKTLAELTTWRHLFNLSSPVIAENGGVIANSKTHLSGLALTQFLPKLHHWRSEHKAASFEGFSDWTPEQVSHATGLSSEEAVLAKQRLMSEPIIWVGSDTLFLEFKTFLAGLGLQCIAGGRFHHVMAGHTKATALKHLLATEPKFQNKEFKIIGLGDSENDRAMLTEADIAVLMPQANGAHLVLHARPGQQIIYSEDMAPLGWVKVINQLVFQGEK